MLDVEFVVTAAAPILKSERADVSTIIENRMITQMPTIGRNIANLQLARVLRRVPEHGYDLYVLSDHGQAVTVPYQRLHGGRKLERWTMCGSAGRGGDTYSFSSACRSVHHSSFVTGTTGSAIEVTTDIRPARASTAASAIGPSSHGRVNTRWSLAEIAVQPRCSAICRRLQPWPWRSTSASRCESGNSVSAVASHVPGGSNPAISRDVVFTGMLSRTTYRLSRASP